MIKKLKKGDSVRHFKNGWTGMILKVNRTHGTVQVLWVTQVRAMWHFQHDVRLMGGR